MDLLEKDMEIVEKLQMTSRKEFLLPLGSVLRGRSRAMHVKIVWLVGHACRVLQSLVDGRPAGWVMGDTCACMACDRALRPGASALYAHTAYIQPRRTALFARAYPPSPLPSKHADSYVAIMAKDRRRYLNWDDVIEAERAFFRGNALLRGLKPERWGIPTLKVVG